MGETETVSSRAIILATLCDCLDSKGCEYSISTSASRRFKLHGLIGKKRKRSASQFDQRVDGK